MAAGFETSDLVRAAAERCLERGLIESMGGRVTLARLTGIYALEDEGE
jgi:hypothetical protein